MTRLSVSSVFHDFEHVAALRSGDGQVRGTCAGFYLVFPALYSDTTDDYLLDR
jgi:hypothetical protein